MKPLDLVILLTAISSWCRADNVTLSWNPNPETNIASYVLYYGNLPRGTNTNPEFYSASTNVSRATRATVQVAPGTNWFFAVAAINSFGKQSDLSNEVTNYVAAAPSAPRRLVIHSGLESAPTLDGPWEEVFTTIMPITIETNRFYRPRLDVTEPPTPR